MVMHAKTFLNTNTNKKIRLDNARGSSPKIQSFLGHGKTKMAQQKWQKFFKIKF